MAVVDLFGGLMNAYLSKQHLLVGSTHSYICTHIQSPTKCNIRTQTKSALKYIRKCKICGWKTRYTLIQTIQTDRNWHRTVEGCCLWSYEYTKAHTKIQRLRVYMCTAAYKFRWTWGRKNSLRSIAKPCIALLGYLKFLHSLNWILNLRFTYKIFFHTWSQAAFVAACDR